ncbi:MAG: hypothetical protein Q4C83_01705 [Candidatus Saccharibacteria bacterium]|nr:hypothetical protein [Candidatus Saccharibacteria bacterium]
MNKEPRASRTAHHADIPDREMIYPYEAVPKSVRSTLERSFDIKDINHMNPDDSREIARRIELDEINSTLKLVRTYCNLELNQSAYQAAALGRVEDLSDGLGNYQQQNIRAKEALGQFFKNNGDEAYCKENLYVAGLLKDRRRLDKFRKYTKSGDDDFDYQREPTAQEWLANPEIADAETLYQLASTINIESVLISGAETLLKLTRSTNNDRRTLDLVRYSEQIVAPVAEVIGFDALAMSLNSTTKTIRLTNGNRPDLVMKANAMIERFRQFDYNHSTGSNVKTAFTDITSQLLGDDNVPLSPTLPVSYGTSNRSVYGDTKVGRIDTPEGEVRVGWRFRLKTPGSLAWKMLQAERKGENSSVAPMDILGITAVANTDEEQAKLFRMLANNLHQSNDIEPYPAPSKTAAICVRGTPDYIEQMTKGLPEQSIDITEGDSADDIHWGKVTGFYGNLPFEIQCVSKHYRDAMQRGFLAHIIYKANKSGTLSDSEINRWTDLLTKISSRRKRLGSLGLIGVNQHNISGKAEVEDDKITESQNFIADCLNAATTIKRTVGFIATEQGKE